MKKLSASENLRYPSQLTLSHTESVGPAKKRFKKPLDNVFVLLRKIQKLSMQVKMSMPSQNWESRCNHLYDIVEELLNEIRKVR